MIEVQLKGTGTGTHRLHLSQWESVAVIRPGLFDDDDDEEFASSDLFGFPVRLVADSAEVPASSSNVTFGIGELELLSSWPCARHIHIGNLFVIDGHSSL